MRDLTDADSRFPRHDDAVRIASEETYERYMKYLTSRADQFRTGHLDLMQFTLAK